jgi:hypothetical protein
MMYDQSRSVLTDHPDEIRSYRAAYTDRRRREATARFDRDFRWSDGRYYRRIGTAVDAWFGASPCTQKNVESALGVEDARLALGLPVVLDIPQPEVIGREQYELARGQPGRAWQYSAAAADYRRRVDKRNRRTSAAVVRAILASSTWPHVDDARVGTRPAVALLGRGSSGAMLDQNLLVGIPAPTSAVDDDGSPVHTGDWRVTVAGKVVGEPIETGLPTLPLPFDVALGAEREAATIRHGRAALRELARGRARARIPWEQRLMMPPLVPDLWRGRLLPGLPLWQAVRVSPCEVATEALRLARASRGTTENRQAPLK